MRLPCHSGGPIGGTSVDFLQVIVATKENEEEPIFQVVNCGLVAGRWCWQREIPVARFASFVRCTFTAAVSA